MWQAALKVAITAAIVVAVSEIGKRSSLWAGVLASLPLTSVLAFAWLYLDTGSTERVALLSHSIFWLVLPSLLLFVLLPYLLAAGLGFWQSLAMACGATIVAYLGTIALLVRLGVRT